MFCNNASKKFISVQDKEIINSHLLENKESVIIDAWEDKKIHNNNKKQKKNIFFK